MPWPKQGPEHWPRAGAQSRGLTLARRRDHLDSHGKSGGNGVFRCDPIGRLWRDHLDVTRRAGRCARLPAQLKKAGHRELATGALLVGPSPTRLAS
jgi:hypothetical protein